MWHKGINVKECDALYSVHPESNDKGCKKQCGAGQYCEKAGNEEKCLCQSGFESKDDNSCVGKSILTVNFSIQNPNK